MSTANDTGMQHSRAAWVITGLSFAVMILATVYVLRANWPSDGWPVLAWQSHVGAMIAVCIEVVTRALKIQASAYGIGTPIPFVTALRVCLAGDFAAAITPARSGAEPARFLVLAEAGVSAASRVIILFLEIVLEMLSLALVCVVLAIVFSGRGTSSMGLLTVVGSYSAVVVGIGVAGFVFTRSGSRGPPPVWARRVGLHGGRWRALQRTLRQVRTSFHALRHADRRYMTMAFIGSVVHVVCKVAALPLLVYLSAPDLAFTRETLAPLVLWPLALFYGGVVVPAPGGGGSIEGAFALTLKDAIPAAVFAASLLWWRFYTFYLYILVGGIAAGEAALRAIRRRTGHARH